MSGDITLHMPGKVERFGIRTHGLVKCPITKLPNGNEVCYLRDYTLTTRGGKKLPVPYTETEKNLSFPPDLCPRPFLYQHPLSVMVAEDSNGNDWSGYVVFYQFLRNNRGYLSNYMGAFTPDDNSQGLLFESEFSYLPPLSIGNPKGQAMDLPLYATGAYELAHISKNGRYRAKGYLSSFGNLDPSFNFPSNLFFAAYSLSGSADTGITVTGQQIDGPDYYFEPSTNVQTVISQYYPVREIVTTAPRYKYGGWCSEPITTSFPVYEYRGYPEDNVESTATYRRRLPIDAYVDESGTPTYLYCSYNFKSVSVSETDEKIVRDSISWGADCNSPDVANGKIPYRDWEITSSKKIFSTTKQEISVSMGGVSSTLSIDWKFDYSTKRTSSFAGDGGDFGPREVNTDSVSSDIITLSVSLDGSYLYSYSMTAYVDNFSRIDTGFYRTNGLFSVLPKAFGSTYSDKLFFRSEYGDGDYIPTNREDNLVELCVGTVKLAEGIHAFCVFIANGKFSERGTPSLFNQRFIVARIFGFGQSKAGFEVPKKDWDKRMFAAYDPLTKTISDIYHHPVFYQ